MIKNKTQIGTIVSLDIPQVSGQLPAMGFDFIFIDLEHGTVSDNTIVALVLAKPPHCKILIRLAEISEKAIKHALDLGCDGIIAPRVESMDEVEMMIAYSYYPPIGKRSLGFVLANKFGQGFNEYVDNFKPILLPQVESVKGVAIAAQIAGVDKVSGIFVGPYDLSMSLGVPGQLGSDVFKNAYEPVRTICKENDKLFATFTVNTANALDEIAKGADMIVTGVDANLFLNMYADMIKQLKGVEGS
jgi:2-keto-3-deoxy-L-rhamnonate aldolase RhmA